jgi:hypothetical protein
VLGMWEVDTDADIAAVMMRCDGGEMK